jgi:glycerol-3-phosphate dehydrogenase subunit B
VTGDLHYDAVVIGAGTAGLTAGAQLAEGGAHVCVLAKGVGSTHLAPGTIDILGYAPERVEEPLRGLERLGDGHPYARLGADAVTAATEWFADRVAAGPHPGYRYVGEATRNRLLPTALGAARPSALVPETMAGGDLAGADPIAVVGLRALRDFHASLCAANLERGGFGARPLAVDVSLNRADANALELARRFDDPGFRAAFAAQLVPRLRAAERVGMPAALGLRDPHGAWTDLEARLGRRVFEIPLLPPSVPGIRVYDVLRRALRDAGGRLVVHSEVVGAERDGDRIAAVRARAAGHDLRYHAPWFVLATGGFASGGIELGSDWVTRETVLDLPLANVPPPGEPRFDPDYLAEQPLARAGVALRDGLWAAGAENVLVAGAALPGAVPWREGSGEGIALASGHRAAALALAEAGARAAA